MRLSAVTADLTADLSGRVFERLDARLNVDDAVSIAVALSGGGDSMALLDLAVRWASSRGRRIVAFTVDHRLNPESGGWTQAAGKAAQGMGADWRALSWDGPKPSTGLPAAARQARHVLIADAARDAGAKVVLFGHTADDRAEEAWMREHGSTLGRVSEWAPSPVWPEGRGLMLFRPLLTERRETLRAYLADQELDWLEDPANVDHRFLRARARAALPEPASEHAVVVPREALADWTGMVALHRDVDARTLSIALTCAAGVAGPPRGRRLSALLERIGTGEIFTATLGGARLEAGEHLRLTREPGRERTPDVVLSPGRPAVWDGRFELMADGPGWRVTALARHMARLDPTCRAIVQSLPASVRPSLPVLIGDDPARPVLAWRAAEARCLVPRRLALAKGDVSHEDGIDALLDGETPPSDLCLRSRVAASAAALEFEA